MMIPTIIDKTPSGERAYDIYSRLLKDRIVILNGEVNYETANSVVAQLLYLDSISHDDITLYINSPGGSIIDGMAIYDVMNMIKSDVSTICIGMAASMGSIILINGAKGKRYILPHGEVLIHQPLGGTGDRPAQATDIEIVAKNILQKKEMLTKILADKSAQSFEKVAADCERDHWLTAEEALEYGIVDRIIKDEK